MNFDYAQNDPRDAFVESSELSPTEQQTLSLHLKLRPELVCDFRDEFDGLFVVVEDPVRNKFFSLGKKEFQFLSTLDGNKTAGDWIDEFGDPSFDKKSAATICQFAINSNLLVTNDLNSAARLQQQVGVKSRIQAFSRFNLISIKLKLFNPNSLLKTIAPKTQWIFSLQFLLFWLVIVGWAGAIAYSQWDRLCDSSVGILSGYHWIWLLGIWIVLKLIHESAHGIACRRYGGDVPEAGVLLLLFTPMAYIDVTSSWRFPSRWQRIVVAGAGMYLELLIASIALIIWSRQPDGLIADACYNVILMASVTTLLFNANPLMRFDGYYILADALKVNNLYTKGTKWFGDLLLSKFFGIPQTANRFKRSERIAIGIYGVLAWGWKVLICVGLIIGASVLFQGAGKIIAVLGGVFFFAIPFWFQFKRLFGSDSSLRPKASRVAMSCTAVCALILCTFMFFRAPATKSAAAIVQFKNEIPIRAESEGFVDEIRVASGADVVADQVLFVLSNPKLQLEIRQLAQDVNASQIQSRIFKQENQLALFQSEQERLFGLQKQLAELKQQHAGLTVRAPFDGFVFARDLESKVGSFIQPGDSLLTIAQRKTKEIVVAIDQQDWESLKGKIGAEMQIAIRSKKLFEAPISRIDPRASDKPRFPELSADCGGPLPIKKIQSVDSHDSARLLTPHFYVDLDLTAEESLNLYAGQRGRAFFQTKRQSMGSYLLVAAENWLKHKIEMATQTSAF